MIIVKNDDELRRMREAGRAAARVRDAVRKLIVPGITTRELSETAGKLIRETGGESAFLGYHGYPGQICISVNEGVVHGIPDDRMINLGDIVSIDVGVMLGGFIGDCATTVMVGVTEPRVIELVQVTERALAAGIAKAVVGNRVGDISHAIEREVKTARFSVVRDFVGHGVGRNLHEEPQIPNYGRPAQGPRLKAGMTLAIEPMVNMGGPRVEVLADRWTVVTRDRLPSAHAEHTVAVTLDGPEILTGPTENVEKN